MERYFKRVNVAPAAPSVADPPAVADVIAVSPASNDRPEEPSPCSAAVEEENNQNGDKPKKPPRKQKFRDVWLQKYLWLTKNEIRGEQKPFCSCCNKFLTNNIGNIIRHDKSEYHRNALKALKVQPQIYNLNKVETFQKKTEKVKSAELKITMFLLEHNLPFSLTGPLISLMKSVAPDSEILKAVKCEKTKVTETTKKIIHEEAVESIAKILRNQKFSIILDETTDVSTAKCLVIVVRYFDFSFQKAMDRFFGLIKLEKSDAITIFKAVINHFDQLNIPKNNIIGLASDNASVMVGEKNGVKALFRQILPNIFFMGCTCHSLHLCSSAACKLMPKEIEKLCRNIYVFFSHSSKRQSDFKEFQDFFNVKAHKILKTSSTRWLSLENVISRILEQWIPLQHYFINYELEKMKT